jgi:hypothetical protein
MFGFSLWLVGLTVVVMAAQLIGLRVSGRPRSAARRTTA